MQAISFSNLYAPEHLIINVTDAEKWEGLIENAGDCAICNQSDCFDHEKARDLCVDLLLFLSPLFRNKLDSFFLLFLVAGSVFLGQWTPESVGDYASGTNHVLPTYGYARMYSGVSLNSFLKYITVQSLSEEGLRRLGPYVAKMAEVEGLEAHKRAVTLRLQEIEAALAVQ